MRALVYHGPHDIGIEERPDPEPGPEEVLLRITATGICGSDLATVEGHASPYFDDWVSFPFVPGHEVVGEVVGGVVGDVVGEVVVDVGSASSSGWTSKQACLLTHTASVASPTGSPAKRMRVQMAVPLKRSSGTAKACP